MKQTHLHIWMETSKQTCFSSGLISHVIQLICIWLTSSLHLSFIIGHFTWMKKITQSLKFVIGNFKHCIKMMFTQFSKSDVLMSQRTFSFKECFEKSRSSLTTLTKHFWSGRELSCHMRGWVIQLKVFPFMTWLMKYKRPTTFVFHQKYWKCP